MLDLLQLLGVMVTVLSLVLAAIILYLFPRLTYSLKLLGVYYVIGACAEMLTFSHSYALKPNLYIFHYYVFLEFFILSIFFKYLYEKLGNQKVLNYTFIPGCILIVANTLFLQPLDTYNSYSSTLVSVAVIAYCVYFFMLVLEASAENLFFKTLKWIVITIFIYHCISIIVLLFSNMIHGIERSLNLMIWGIRAVIILVLKLIVLYQFGRILHNFLINKTSINDRQ